MEFKYNNVLIWGYGVSGRAVEKVLIDIDCNYSILDEDEKIKGGGFLDKLTKKDILKFDLIVLSPGIDFNRWEIGFAKANNINVISEIEFGYMFLCSKTKIIAVTGTNGKTTTTDMICKLLCEANFNAVAVGNIGKPLSEIYGKKYDFVVVELSSFQLHSTKNFKADIGVVLNISFDHIDRHKTYQNYINSKLKIFNNQQKKDVAIINFDDEILKEIKDINSSLISFSKTSNLVKFYIRNNIVFKGRKKILNLDEFNIPGVFIDDVLALVCVSDTLKIDLNILNKMLKDYKFMSHRCEYVTKIKDIEFYNDSKATNIHATISNIENINKNNIMLLLGGRNKGLDFKEFIEKIDSKVVRKILCFGEYGKKLYKLKKFNKNIQFFYEKSLHTTMENLTNYLSDISCVIFSPACASFDEFNSYVDRGDFFKKSVMELKANYDKI